MSAQLIDGKTIAKQSNAALADQLKQLKANYQSTPCLAVVIVGDDEASQIYVKRKRQKCDKLGIDSQLHHLDNSATQKQLIELVDTLNQDEQVHGILVQLPLPEAIDEQAIIERIDPIKDVDGFHPINMGRLAQKIPFLKPCTPLGVMTLLNHINFDFYGQHAVMVGASNIVGRPMSLELLTAGCTTTVCHRPTRDLAYYVKQADLLVTAVGIPDLIKGDWIKSGAVVVDVGITRLDDGSLTGDVEFEMAKRKASWITPVPGGVGPMTVAMLMHNTVQAWQAQLQQ